MLDIRGIMNGYFHGVVFATGAVPFGAPGRLIPATGTAAVSHGRVCEPAGPRP
ncbi:MAG: hypothetical protein ACYC2X_00880 [Coriobacteriia bacterium]